jgi:hypothetical protein
LKHPASPPPQKKGEKEREGGREKGTYIFWCCDTSEISNPLVAKIISRALIE